MENKKQNPMIDQMLKLAEIADVLTKKQAKEFVNLLMEFAVKQKNDLSKSFSDNTDNLTREVYKKIQDALFNISQKHSDALLEVRQLTNKQKKAHEDAMAKIELLVEELKAMEKQDGIDGVDGKDGIDGKDGSPDTREQIVEKINSGKDKDTKIEAKQITGLPEFTREVVREVGTTFQTETPLKAGANITITKDASGANVITGSAGGGSGDMLKATYDPFNVAADVFDLDNISQGATNKYVTATDLTHLSNLSGTNTGDQSFSNGSDATSHTLSLSGVGGSIKLVEGSNITLTTTGTAGDGIVTIASTASGGSVGPGTINELAYFDTTTSIASLSVATYPSLTELSYVKGVTSAIQTQLDAKLTSANIVATITNGDTTHASSSDALFDALALKAPLTSPTFATSITGSYLTASEILITDGSKNIVSAAVATYPSLTELTYLKGVTSAIQTQLNAKQATLISGTNIKTINGVTLLGSSDIVIDATVTLADLSTNSATAPNSLYTMTSTIPVEFRSSDGNTLLYLDETNERIGIGTASPGYKLDVLGSLTAAVSMAGKFVAGTSGASGGFYIGSQSSGYGGIWSTNITPSSSNYSLASNGGDVYVNGDNVRLAVSGAVKWIVNASGHLVANADNTYDIGASGATRPRTGYFGTSVVTPLLTLGTGSITMTGSIAATGARVTKGWFTDIESTNMPTVGGTAILTSLTAPQFTTIELGHASANTLSASGGVLSVEGVRVITSAGTTSGTILKNNGTTFVASTETYAAPGTSGNVMTSDGTNWTSAAASGATCVTVMPESAIHPHQNSAPSLVSTGTNTTMNVGQVIIPFKITANKISIDCISNGGTTGTLDLTMYSEDGQTQIFSVTTASIDAATNVTVTTALSSVVINPGIYYIAVNPNSTANLYTYYFTSTNTVYGAGGLAIGLPGNVTSEPIMTGTYTITAGTPPATITPGSITYADNTTLICRLDN